MRTRFIPSRPSINATCPASLRILQEIEAAKFGYSLGGQFRINRRPR